MQKGKKTLSQTFKTIKYDKQSITMFKANLGLLVSSQVLWGETVDWEFLRESDCIHEEIAIDSVLQNEPCPYSVKIHSFN